MLLSDDGQNGGLRPCPRLLQVKTPSAGTAYVDPRSVIAILPGEDLLSTVCVVRTGAAPMAIPCKGSRAELAEELNDRLAFLAAVEPVKP